MLPPGIDINDLPLAIARHGAADDHVDHINKTRGFNAWFSLATNKWLSVIYQRKNCVKSCGNS